MKNIGYLSGTDSDFLTKMVCMGFKTTPLGNGEDKHGKDVSFINISDDVDIIIGYLHKFTPLPKDTKSFKDHLNPAIINKIPMIILVPNEFQEKANQLIKEVTDTDKIILLDPNELYEEATKILSTITHV